jgi:hypothetical protein
MVFSKIYSNGPLSSAAEALERFASPTFAVGVRLESDDRLHIDAPFGLADVFALCLRPNPRGKRQDKVAVNGPALNRGLGMAYRNRSQRRCGGC